MGGGSGGGNTKRKMKSSKEDKGKIGGEREKIRGEKGVN